MKRPIAFVVETGSLSGGVRVIGEYANRLADRGWEVSIWSVNPRETMGWFRIDSRVEWHSFFKTGTTMDYEPLTTVLKKQDCIKCATYWRTAYAVAEAAKEGEGVYLVQDIETSYTSQPVFGNLVMQTYQAPIRKFTTSRWVEKGLPNTTYVGIGLENKYRPNLNLKRDKNILACARIQSLKGWDVLCESSRYITAMGGKMVTFGMDKKIPMFVPTTHHVMPSDDKVRQLYQISGVFMSQTIHEGFGLPMLEAMACGAPVSCTDADGNREFIEDGENCLVAKDNSPFYLAENCVKILNDKELASKLSANGPKVASRYRWAPVIDRLEEFLQE